MLVSEWLYGAIALLVGIHILTMLYAYRQGGTATGGTQAEPEPHPTPNNEPQRDGRVNCPHCGVPNHVGYRFCKQCVADLNERTPHRQSVEQSQPY
jgi:hypothetical protein